MKGVDRRQVGNMTRKSHKLPNEEDFEEGVEDG